MAERVTPTTQVFKREQLEAFLKDPRSIRQFEQMVKDLQATIPDPVNANATELEEMQTQQASTDALARTAYGLAMKLRDLTEANSHLLTAIVQLRGRLTRLERMVTDLQDAPL